MRKFILTVLFVLFPICSVSAAITDLNIEKDFSNNRIVISGTALADESITLQILPEDTTLSDFVMKSDDEKNAAVAFVYEEKASETGEFSIDAVIKTQGNYVLYVATNDTSVIPKSNSISFYTSTDYATVISTLNDKTNETDFVTYAKEKKSELGFDESINDVISIDDILKFMYNAIDGANLDSAKFAYNVNLYKNSFAAEALNRNKISEVFPYVKNIIDDDATLKKYWEQYVVNDEIEKFLVSKISGKTINSLGDLKLKLQEGLVLAATKYPNGYMSLYNLYSDYKDIIGLSSVSSDSTVYSEIGAKEYADITTLKNTYNSKVSTSNSQGGSASNNSNGGNRVTAGGSSIGSIIIGGQVDNGTEVLNQPINLKFIDLTTYEWAYPSISRLFEAGIVNGISDNQFAPSREVKREEFVKMVVAAMGLDIGSGSVFDDVDDSQWYAPYVYSAYNAGIINGVSNNNFGVSTNIRRQDMAVIIYKAIVLNGYMNKESDLKFGDSDDISDYAKESVEQLVALGIISGMDNNRFAPMEVATRAQAAVIIERAMKYLK